MSIDVPEFLTDIAKVLRHMTPARRWQRMMHFRCVGQAHFRCVGRYLGQAGGAHNSFPRNGTKKFSKVSAYVQRPGGMSTSVQSLLLAVRRRRMRGMGRQVGICSRFNGNFRLVCVCVVVYRVRGVGGYFRFCLCLSDSLSPPPTPHPPSLSLPPPSPSLPPPPSSLFLSFSPSLPLSLPFFLSPSRSLSPSLPLPLYLSSLLARI
jgi:hypothetical protein